MATKSLPVYTTPEAFLFSTPPYDVLKVTETNVAELVVKSLRLDGYCPYCQQPRTFSRSSAPQSSHWLAGYENDESHLYGELRLTCTRHDHHTLRFHFYLNKGTIQKTGQFPSFASIAFDESKKYNKLLSKGDAEEFHRAIGLAAHNVGIGSFVYGT